ncbi:MAG TPA: carbon monoxide dehydrogenase subunit G [Ktedonobacteraceae bacterium]|nr:carbon monoxide dehydrogenase subunit G [Ktedonobacteraceae bacterium]
MDIDGTYTLQAPQEVVWNLLMDIQTLQHTIQGMERLERTGDDTYAFTLHIKLSPLRGSYSGVAVATKMDYPYRYHMKAEGEGAPGRFQAEWDITLTALDENTVVGYQGTLEFSNAKLPSSLVKGTTKVLIQQFFTSVADLLRTADFAYQDDSEVHVDQSGDVYAHEAHKHYPASQEQSSLLLIIVRQLGLGDKDPVLEQEWVNRLRRIGFISMLLFFVWVGTRLPRRARVQKSR